MQNVQDMEIVKRKLLFTLVFLLFIPILLSSANIKNIPVVKLFDKEYYKYEIKKKQSLYSICKTFKVTEAELLSMNPFLSNGVNIGQTLLIPVASEKETTTNIEQDKIDITTDEKLLILPSKTPRITVLLPFTPSDSPGSNERYLEFYEGFLLAVDSLKSIGLSFEVNAIDVGYKTEGIQNAISEGKLEEADYIIGGINTDQINLLSDWSKLKKKNVVLPFSSRISAIDDNPFLFQTNTPYSHIYKRFSDYASIRYIGMNIIFVDKNDDLNTENRAFVTILKDSFRKKGLKFKEVIEDENLDALSLSLDKYRKNLIIPIQMPVNDASSFITKLSTVAAKDTTKSISIIGYPEWQAMNKRVIPRLHELNAYIFSNFYADFQNHNVKSFPVIFSKTFGKELLNTYPKYGMMGFDIASWFIPRMVFEKSTNPLVKGPTAVQNDFSFKALTSGSGALNQTFYIINYKKNNTVEVKQLK